MLTVAAHVIVVTAFLIALVGSAFCVARVLIHEFVRVLDMPDLAGGESEARDALYGAHGRVVVHAGSESRPSKNGERAGVTAAPLDQTGANPDGNHAV